jgi:hypothetical protein
LILNISGFYVNIRSNHNDLRLQDWKLSSWIKSFLIFAKLQR